MKSLLALACALVVSAAHAEKIPVYFGTYTRAEGSQGIYLSQFDTDSGALTAPVLAGEVKNPSFLAAHPSGKYLYASVEDGGGAVAAFAILEDGKLKHLGSQSSKGGGACHVWVTNKASHVLVANYGGGSVAALPIQGDGSLGAATGFSQHSGSSVNPKRQEKPHAHAVYTDEQGKIYVPDLGLDQVLMYKLNDKGELTEAYPPLATLPAGSGPRHMALAPRHAYVINELLSTVTVFRRDANAGLIEEQTISTLPAGWEGNSSTAEIFLHPNGKFLYGSNRGHDSIVVYSVAENGKLTLIGHASTQGVQPRNFAIAPDGRHLLAANQNTGNVVVFKIDPETGRLTPAGHSVNVDRAVCVLFPPAVKK